MNKLSVIVEEKVDKHENKNKSKEQIKEEK